MAVRKKGKNVSKRRKHDLGDMWPKDDRTPNEIVIEHRHVAMAYIQVRCCHD